MFKRIKKQISIWHLVRQISLEERNQKSIVNCWAMVDKLNDAQRIQICIEMFSDSRKKISRYKNKLDKVLAT